MEFQYVEREEDEEIKKIFEEEKAKDDLLFKKIKENVDGEIFIDALGNIKFEKTKNEKPEGGLKETGTYVLRDGKLVLGEGEKREEA